MAVQAGVMSEELRQAIMKAVDKSSKDMIFTNPDNAELVNSAVDRIMGIMQIQEQKREGLRALISKLKQDSLNQLATESDPQIIVRLLQTVTKG